MMRVLPPSHPQPLSWPNEAVEPRVVAVPAESSELYAVLPPRFVDVTADVDGPTSAGPLPVRTGHQRVVTDVDYTGRAVFVQP